jgi:hypothetical protein
LNIAVACKKSYKAEQFVWNIRDEMFGVKLINFTIKIQGLNFLQPQIFLRSWWKIKQGFNGLKLEQLKRPGASSTG